MVEYNIFNNIYSIPDLKIKKYYKLSIENSKSIKPYGRIQYF